MGHAGHFVAQFAQFLHDQENKQNDKIDLHYEHWSFIRFILTYKLFCFTGLLGVVMIDKIPLTQQGYDALSSELKQLKSTDRPSIIKAIAEARAHGDLSENAEYHAAREKQSFIEGRIQEIETILGLAQVIDPTALSGAIKFGATVTIADEDTDKESTYKIVGEAEANVEKGMLNIKSPLAQALIGKNEGDSVDVKTPGGVRSFEIISIRWI